MTPDDDPPGDNKKPPRASWEPPDPDEPAVPRKPADRAPSRPVARWTPPPAEPSPPKKKRAETKPPRASWEAADPAEPGSISGSWETPSVIVEPATSVVATEPSGHVVPAASVAEPSVIVESAPASAAPAEPGAPGAQQVYATTAEDSGGYPQAAPEYAAATTSGAHAQPEYAPATTSGAYAQPEYAAATTSDAYAQPEYAATSSGAYAQPEYATGASPQPADPSSSGAHARPTAASSTGSARASSRTAAKESDDPMAPLSADDALRAAVGARPKKSKAPPPPDDFGDDDELGGPPKRRGWWVIAMVLVGVLGLGIGALVIFGNINKQRFLITCEPQEVHAKQGRGFPPWGERGIDDEGMWKPIPIPPEAECRERETEDEEELSGWYLEILVDRASSLLTAREVTKIDEAAALLEQALLHARSPDRRDRRHDVERLLGDVGYWRASAKLKDAAAALTDAAKQFDTAAAQRPRHVSDASAWAAYVRKLVDELRAGPNGALTAFPPSPPPTPGREPAPPGVALPVEPPPDAGVTETPPAPPDAGLPTGGVLL